MSESMVYFHDFVNITVKIDKKVTFFTVLI